MARFYTACALRVRRARMRPRAPPLRRLPISFEWTVRDLQPRSELAVDGTFPFELQCVVADQPFDEVFLGRPEADHHALARPYDFMLDRQAFHVDEGDPPVGWDVVEEDLVPGRTEAVRCASRAVPFHETVPGDEIED